MVADIVVNHTAHIGYSERSGAAYSFAASAEPSPTATADAEDSSEKIAFWGASNDFPNLVEKEIEKNPDLANVLDWKARALYSGGLTYKVMQEDAEGNATYIDRVIPEIEAFLKRNLKYRVQAPANFYTYYNVFPELTLSLDRKQIVFLTPKEPKDCRFAIQNKQTRTIDTVYLNSRWDQGASANDKDTVAVPCIDPSVYTAEMLRMRSDSLNYIYPVSYPTGKKYYQLAHWNSIRVSKWLELANSIPYFKIALMKNQLTIKYHIQMPDYWMEWKYPGFKALEKEKRKELTEGEIKKFDNFLTGVENAGKSLTSVFKTDPNTLKEYGGWKITPIEDKLPQGAYLEDSVEATIKIYSAVGVDPALAGIIPGKGGSNRSGSDKREAFNAYISLCQIHEDLILQPYDFIAEYNGWNATYGQIVWGFIKPYLQTLNEVTPSQRNTTNGEDI